MAGTLLRDMRLQDVSKPFDELGQADRAFLDSIQGNILKGHGRLHARYLFLEFDHHPNSRATLGKVLPQVVTSALKQAEQIALHKSGAAQGPDGGGFAHFALSSSGYRNLGLQDFGPSPEAPYFHAGFRNEPDATEQARYLIPWDNQNKDVACWQKNYRDNSIDALLLLANDDEARLETEVARVKNKLARSGLIIAEERGRKFIQKNHQGFPIEHFGFRDGIATPAKPLLAMVQEKPLMLGRAAVETYGTFALYLKFEQDVASFGRAAEQAAAEVARQSARNGYRVTAEDIKALAVGRHRSGVSLVDAPIDSSADQKAGRGRSREDIDRFNYSGPGVDGICPVHSHVRKMNVRNPAGPDYQLVRRGMLYGGERSDLEDGLRQLPPSEGVGLLFMSYQKSIRDALRLLARAADKVAGRNMDALLARTKSCRDRGGEEGAVESTSGGQLWQILGEEIRFEMANFVTIRGGEYFFVPSMHFIRNLSSLRH